MNLNIPGFVVLYYIFHGRTKQHMSLIHLSHGPKYFNQIITHCIFINFKVKYVHFHLSNICVSSVFADYDYYYMMYAFVNNIQSLIALFLY